MIRTDCQYESRPDWRTLKLPLYAISSPEGPDNFNYCCESSVELLAREEYVIPVQIDKRFRGTSSDRRIQEDILWNMFDTGPTIERFMHCFVWDNRLLPKAFPVLVNELRTQLLRAQRLENDFSALKCYFEEVLKIASNANQEFLVTVEYDVEQREIRVEDRFLWNISNRHNDIKPFVERLVHDMDIPIQFTNTLIGSIWRNIQSHRQQLVRKYPEYVSLGYELLARPASVEPLYQRAPMTLLSSSDNADRPIEPHSGHLRLREETVEDAIPNVTKGEEAKFFAGSRAKRRRRGFSTEKLM